MATHIIQGFLSIDRFTHLCQKGSVFLVQQTYGIINLFNQISLERHCLLKKDSFGWEPAPLFYPHQEQWTSATPLHSKVAAYWKSNEKTLELRYNEDRELIAELKSADQILSIHPSKIYMQWGKDPGDLRPYLLLDGQEWKLYLFDQAETAREKVLCGENVGVIWKAEELEDVMKILQVFLQTHHQSRVHTPEHAIRLQECLNAVCRISTPTGTGTGFVIGNRLLMTNHHVLPNKEKCERSRAEFFYNNVANEVTVIVDFDPDVFFMTSKSPDEEGIEPLKREELDFTIVALKIHKKLEDVFAHPISLDKPESARVGNQVLVIHHPVGKEKKICLPSDNRILGVFPLHVVHSSCVDPGSSGAPPTQHVSKNHGLT